MAHLGEILAELQQDRGLTQKDLGEILCVSSGTVSNYENGVHMPDAEKLVVLADYFHVTSDYLLGRTSSSVSPDLLQKPFFQGKTFADLLATIAHLPADRQRALALIVSDMELSLMLSEYRKQGEN